MARRYKLPYRTSNTYAANTVDAQAAYECVFSLWGAIMGGGNLIHACGRLDGGRPGGRLTRNSPSTATCCRCWRSSSKPLDMSDDALGLDAIREVGPGGHFFGAGHTLERYATAFYAPIVSDWRNFQQWTAAGRPQAGRRPMRSGSRRWPNIRNRAIDPAIREEIDRLRRTPHPGGRREDRLLDHAPGGLN